MKKFNLSNIMKRAWAIKKEEDRKTWNRISNMESRPRSLKSSEKAIFSECLKLAWEEEKEAYTYAKTLEISLDSAKKVVEFETELKLNNNGSVCWRIWTGYGKVRAYYKCDGWSKYANDKKTNFIELGRVS